MRNHGIREAVRTMKYTDEKNIQILISLLKKHNIKNIIASPGATNISFVASVQDDGFFNVYSCVDERSAAYLACGMAEETGEPVVITCTGATASRNYVPGLTEAFYRKLPVIAVTASQHFARIGQNVPQVIDRSVQLNDTVKKNVQIGSVRTDEDRWECNLKINDALLETKNDGGGPVLINIVTDYCNGFNCEKLPDERKIDRISADGDFPEIKGKNVAVYIGAHCRMSDRLTGAIQTFCEKYNAAVLCDRTSNYNGKYKVPANIIFDQEVSCGIPDADLLIDIGNVSGSYMSVRMKEVWRVNPDGIIRDKWRKLRYIFKAEEVAFFEKYNGMTEEVSDLSYYDTLNTKRLSLEEKFNALDLPFSNIFVAREINGYLRDGDIVHLGILNTLRSWNFIMPKTDIPCFCNTGGFGIDGVVSTALGASLATDKTVYCIVGDLAFFYDMNVIGNRELKNNLRILLINNGCGTEFRNYNHRAVSVAENTGVSLDYISASGHFGNRSPDLVRNYAEDLGFRYFSARNKDEFFENIAEFTAEDSDRPMLFEIFTDPDCENAALKMTKTLEVNAKSVIKSILGEKGVKIAKKLLNR